MSIYFLLFLTFLVYVITPCDAIYYYQPQNQIIDGEFAMPQEFPFMAALFKKGEKYICCGTIIGEYFVLTAAHCGDEEDDSNISHVRVGSTISDKGVRYEVAKFHSHEEFDPFTVENDIAIIKVNKRIRYNANIQPLRVVSDVAANERLVSVGWGKINFEGKRTKNLKYAHVVAIDLELCKKIIMSQFTVNEKQQCALYSSGQPFTGDSGGPLLVLYNGRAILKGVSSFGSKRKVFLPTVYTKVALFMEWIEKTLTMLSNIRNY